MMIYDTRKEAKAIASGGDFVVKVSGGYAVMTACEYYVWRNQR